MVNRKIYTNLLFGLIFCLFYSVTAQAETGYCEGHPKKIVVARRGGSLVEAVQQELNRYGIAEYSFNGRQELCLQMQDNNVDLGLDRNQKLIINNMGNKEVVVGFLKAKRNQGHEDAILPILEIRGTNITLFSPEMSNVKKAVTLQGTGHKIVNGTINGVANAADSLCVSGNTAKSEIKNLTINDCTNAISLNGNENVVADVNILSHVSDYVKKADESPEAYAARILAARPTWPSGTCISMSGDGGSLKGLYLDKCYGVGVKILGNNYRLEGNDIQGEAEFDSDKTRYSTDCLLVKKSSGIILESNEISNCQQAIHIEDSQQVTVGPEQLKDFETKHNKIHNNDYAIHAQSSQQIFAWHNSVYGNGVGLSLEEAYHVGLWLDSTNFLETVLLKDPIFESVDKTLQGDTDEVPVVIYGSEDPFVEVNVPMKSGWVEFSFPEQSTDSKWFAWYQSQTPFTDCHFENIIMGSNGYGKTKCPIEVTEETAGKRVIATVHSDNAGSSPVSATLGILNGPSTIPSIPISTPPVSFVGDTGNNPGQAMAGGPGVLGQAAGGGGKASSCSLSSTPTQTNTLPTFLWYTFVMIFLFKRRMNS